jgi:hypothetical protein
MRACTINDTQTSSWAITSVIWDITPLVSPPSSELDAHVQCHRDTSCRVITWSLGTLKLHAARSMRQLGIASEVKVTNVQP